MHAEESGVSSSPFVCICQSCLGKIPIREAPYDSVAFSSDTFSSRKCHNAGASFSQQKGANATSGSPLALVEFTALSEIDR